MDTPTVFERLVNRTLELSTLLQAFARAAADGCGATLIMTGEGGVGKSRLLREFSQHIAGRRHSRLIGHCLEYVRIPYGPFLEALGGELRWTRDIEHVLRGDGEARGAPADDEKARRFASVRDVLKRRSAICGVLVLALEDLQWCDVASLELLRYLSRNLRDASVLLIGTFRSDEVGANHAVATNLAKLLREGAVALPVPPLSDADIMAALRSAVPPGTRLDSGEIAAICGLAEGRPFIAEELLRATLQGSSRSRVPTSIRASILERFERFQPEARLVLMQAAAVGREFDLALISQISQASEELIVATLRAAADLQLISEDRRTGRFAFRHAISRAVLYDELLIIEARALHRDVAVALEAMDAEARADEIAYHWWAAGAAQEALKTNTEAGDRAARVFAFGDAARFFAQALDFAPRASEARLSLLERLTYAACTNGDLTLAQTACEEAASEAALLGRDEPAQRLTLWFARQSYESGQSHQSLAMVERVLQAPTAGCGTPVHFAAQMTKAAMLALLGAGQEALDIQVSAFERSVVREPVEEFRGENARGNALCALGQYSEALDAFQRALEIAHSVEDTDLVLHAWINRASVAIALGQMAKAGEDYTTALRVASERGFRRMEWIIAANAALAHLLAGELARSRELLDLYGSAPVGSAGASVLLSGVEIRLAALTVGAVVADDMLERTAAAAFETEDPQLIALIAGAVGHYHLAVGNIGLSAELVERALPKLGATDFGYWVFDVAIAAGSESTRAATLSVLHETIARSRTRPALAYRDLVNAGIARSRGASNEVMLLARRAHSAFASFPWPYEAARSLELAGDDAEALATYRKMDASRDVRRLEDKLGKRRTKSASTHPTTRREEQVLALLVRGYSAKGVAEQLCMSERTVESHVASLYRKFGVKSRVELITSLRQVVF